MTILSMKSVLASVAVSAAMAVAMAASPASAQSQYTNGPDGMQPNTLKDKPHSTKRYRPLTVRRVPGVAPVAAAAAAPAAAAPNLITAPLGAASTIVGAPFGVLGGIFPADGPRKGGVTAVRYVGTGAKQAEIDEGWTQAVPVDRSGPIYVVANGDPNVSPLTFIGQPIRAVGTLAQTPFKVLGAPFGGIAAY